MGNKEQDLGGWKQFQDEGKEVLNWNKHAKLLEKETRKKALSIYIHVW